MTRREKHILVFIILLLVVLAFIPQSTIEQNEVIIIIFTVGPLGIYIATDPERKKHNE